MASTFLDTSSSGTTTYTAATNKDNSDAWVFSGWTKGNVFVPYGTNATALKWYAQAYSGGDWYRVHDGSGSHKSSTIDGTGVTVSIPSECAGAFALKVEATGEAVELIVTLMKNV